jgi:FKBP-type peptidyl-prolyl cis-trans isomerase SlpA
MNEAAQIVPGARVSLHLAINLEDGSEAISTFGEEPVECVMGDGTLQPGLELALYGLSAGEQQRLRLLPEQAFGLRDTGLIRHMPLSDFEAAFTPEVGQVIAFSLPNGEEAAGTVLAVEQGQVEMDFNHPLAGHEIEFVVEIIEVSPPASD